MEGWEVVVEPKEETGNKRAPERKTREFNAFLLGHVSADLWWAGGAAGKGDLRPVFLQIANSEAALRPVVVNLRLGQRAAIYPHRPQQVGRYNPRIYLELLKSGGYKAAHLKQTVGRAPGAPVTVVSTIYQPGLFRQSAGALPGLDRVEFLCLAPEWWVQQGRVEYAGQPDKIARVLAHFRALGGLQPPGRRPVSDAELTALLPWAIYVLSFLDARAPQPLVTTEAFYLQIFLAALEAHIFTLAWPVSVGERECSWGQAHREQMDDPWWWAHDSQEPGFTAYGMKTIGMLPPVGCRVSMDDLEAFLVGQVARYFAAQAQIDQKAPPLDGHAQQRAMRALVQSGAIPGRI